MKKIIIFFFAIQCSLLLQAQLTQIIKGKVVDKESKAALIGAYVMQSEFNPVNAVVTDTYGNFKITVPVGRVNLKITYVGYEDVSISELLVMSGKEVLLNIEMRENVEQMREVVVKAYKDKKYKESIELCESSIKYNENKAETYVMLGNNYYQLNDINKTLYGYEKALQIDPNQAEARKNYEMLRNSLTPKNH